ncbi:MAG: hypothetical protein QM796_13670 [Chthoniobacteraceae bacterium]
MVDRGLVGVGVFQHGHGGEGAQDPGELAHLRDVGLFEKGGPGGIEAAGKEIHRDAAGVFLHQLRIAQGGQGVVIRDKVKGLALFLPVNGRAHHAKIVADVQAAGRFDSR